MEWVRQTHSLQPGQQVASDAVPPVASVTADEVEYLRGKLARKSLKVKQQKRKLAAYKEFRSVIHRAVLQLQKKLDAEAELAAEEVVELVSEPRRKRRRSTGDADGDLEMADASSSRAKPRSRPRTGKHKRQSKQTRQSPPRKRSKKKKKEEEEEEEADEDDEEDDDAESSGNDSDEPLVKRRAVPSSDNGGLLNTNGKDDEDEGEGEEPLNPDYDRMLFHKSGAAHPPSLYVRVQRGEVCFKCHKENPPAPRRMKGRGRKKRGGTHVNCNNPVCNRFAHLKCLSGQASRLPYGQCIICRSCAANRCLIAERKSGGNTTDLRPRTTFNAGRIVQCHRCTLSFHDTCLEDRNNRCMRCDMRTDNYE